MKNLERCLKMTKRGRHKKECECEKCQIRKAEQRRYEKTDDIVTNTSINEVITEGIEQDNVLFDKLAQVEQDAKKEIEEQEKNGLGVEKIILRGSFFVMAGERLKKLTGEEGYLLTESEASALCETIVECLKAMNYKIHPVWVLIISLAMWLGLPTLSFLYKHKNKIKTIFDKIKSSGSDKKE